MVDTNKILNTLDGLGPEVAKDLIQRVKNPLQGFYRRELTEDFNDVQPQKKVALNATITNDGGKSKDHTGKQGLGMHIYFVDKHILTNQQNDNAKAGQQVFGNYK